MKDYLNPTHLQIAGSPLDKGGYLQDSSTTHCHLWREEMPSLLEGGI